MRTIFIDDSKDCRDDLRKILRGCPDVNLVGEATNVTDGYELIKREKPELAILDVELTPYTSFDLLNRLYKESVIDFEIIFLTAFLNYEYPKRAIQYSALAFEDKPIDEEKLLAAIRKAKECIDNKNREAIPPPQYQAQIQLLLQNLQNNTERKSRRIAIHRPKNLIEFVLVDDIIYCKAEGEITHIYLKTQKEPLKAIRHLGFYAKPLEIDFDFTKIRNNILLNLDYVKSYQHADDYPVTLTTGEILEASRQFAPDFRTRLNEFYAQNSASKTTSKEFVALTPEVENNILKSFFKRLLGM
jgi:two-component system, LytTR family, response regulator